MVRRLAQALWNWLLELPLAVRDAVGLARRRSSRMRWRVRDAASEAPFVLRDRLTALVTSPLYLRRARGVVLVAAVPLLPALAAFLLLTGRQADRATAAGPVAYRVVPDRPLLLALSGANEPEAAPKAAPEAAPNRKPLPGVRAQRVAPKPVVAHLVTRPTEEATEAAPPTPRVAPRVSKPRAEPRPVVPAETAKPASVPTRTVPAGTVVAEASAAAPAAAPAAPPASAPATVPREEPRERHGRRGHDDEEEADEEDKDNSGKGKGDDDEEEEKDDKSGKGKGDDGDEDEDEDDDEDDD